MPGISTTEQRLQSWPWRLGHSVWTLWGVLGLGTFTWVGFAYIGVRARNRLWLLMAGIWMAILMVLVAVLPTPIPDSWGGILIMVWCVSIAHTLLTLPAWWRWRAAQGGPDYGRIERRGATPAAAVTPLADTPQATTPPGAVPAPAPVSTPPSSTPPSAQTHASGFADVTERATVAVARGHDVPLGLGAMIPGLGVIDGQPEDGHGSFGTVYRIRREFDGKHVAGKVFRPQPGLHGSHEAERALRDEMAALEQLQHPNIVRVMNPVRVGPAGSWMLVSEWVDGTTLELATLGIVPMTDEWVFHVGRQLLDALVYLESVGVVHRDIKPTNVMIDSVGVVKLIDFNLTRTSGRETAIAGTKPYLPPDHLLDGNAVDALVDRFATGVVLFELLTRKHPYVEYEHAAAPVLPTSAPADPRAFRPDLSWDLAAFLTRSVQPREAHRFASAAEMRAAWLAATSSTVGSIQSTPESTTSPADPNDEAAATA